MSLKNLEYVLGAMQVKPSRVEASCPQFLFGHDLTKFSDTQARQVFVLLKCHLDDCPTCKPGGPHEPISALQGVPEATSHLLAVAALFRDEHSKHLPWPQLRRCKEIFEAVLAINAVKSPPIDVVDGELQETASRCSSSSCFSYRADAKLTTQTLVHRSLTEKFPFPPQTSHSPPPIPAPQSQLPTPDAASFVPENNQSSKKQNLNLKSNLRSFFHKSSKKARKADKTTNNERKRDKVRRFFRFSKVFTRHKKHANQTDTLNAQLVKRDGHLALQKYRGRTIYDFCKGILMQYGAHKLTCVLEGSVALKPSLIKKSKLADVKAVPKLLCWYEVTGPVQGFVLDNLRQSFQPGFITEIEVPLDSVPGCNLTEAWKPTLVAMRVVQDLTLDKRYRLCLPLSFYAIEINSKFCLDDVVESWRYSGESKILSNAFGFQNYDFNNCIEPLIADCGFCDDQESIAASDSVDSESTAVSIDFAADDFPANTCLESASADFAQELEKILLQEELSADISSLASTFVGDYQVELTTDSNSLERGTDNEPPAYAPEIMVDDNHHVESLEFPELFAHQRSNIAAIVEASVSFPKVHNRVLVYFAKDDLSPFLLGDDYGEVLTIIENFEYPPVSFCLNDTQYECEAQEHYHIVRCVHDTPCNMHAPYSLSSVLDSLVPPTSVLYKFGLFVNLAYPRLGFKALELVDYEVIESLMEQRAHLLEAMQARSVEWLVKHRHYKLQVRQALKFADLVNSRHPKQALKRIEACSPEDAKDIRKLPRKLHEASIDEFVKASRIRHEVFLKRCEAREFMMHQTYMGLMAVLLDPEYEIPSNFVSLFVDGFDDQIEQSYRTLDYATWVELSGTTDSIDTASITFMWLNGVIDTHYEHDAIFREFTRELLEMK